MNVRILTEEQKNMLVGHQFSDSMYFNPIQDANDNWVISENEVDQCTNVEFSWVNTLDVIVFEPKIESFS